MAIVAALLLGTGSTAREACSSTPSEAAISDPVGDIFEAIDVSSIDLSLDAACKLTVTPSFNPPLTDQDSVNVYFDSDGNAATGDPEYDGADHVVELLGGASSAPPSLFPCPSACDFLNGVQLPPTGGGGFVVMLDQLGVESSKSVGVEAEALRQLPPPEDFILVDYAPDMGSHTFPVALSTPPTATAAPPPAVEPPATRTVRAKKKKCTVPKLKGKTVARARRALKKAGCRYKIKGKGKVASTKPKAGTRTSGTVQVKAKKKKRKRR
jgi:hypothetical protein